MSERILRISNDAIGMLSLPASAPHPIGVIILNAGRIHRVGPFRLHVDLARQLAAAGHAVLRLDAPGIGDSSPVAADDRHAYVGQAMQAMRAACGCERFVLGGICAAADEAWQIARLDPRVAGVILIDGVARRTPWYWVGRASLALRRPPAKWLAKARQIIRSRAARKADVLRVEVYREWPAMADLRAEFADMLARGVFVLSIFTGGASGYFAHPRQFAGTFGVAAKHPQVCFCHWSDVDHLFFDPQHRRRLIDTVSVWLARISHYPSAADADPLAVTGRTPSSRHDVVMATPAASFGPCTPPQRRLGALVTKCSEKCEPAQCRC